MTPARTSISRAEKDAILLRNRQRLDQDLVSRRLVWESRPRIIDLQLSNICNMSCTMCYDGGNPAPQRLATEVVEKFAAEALPTAAAIVPFAGSEPLIVTWDLTKDLAQRFDLELELITNAQFLDEKKFQELEPHVSSVTFSIDSHIREIYERIRLRSQPDKVFANLARAIKECRAHGIEPIANVVWMVENCAYLEETVAFLADQGCTTIQLLAFRTPYKAGHDRGFSDAIRHMSPEWTRWKLGQIRAVAREKKIRVSFWGLSHEVWDHRPKGIGYRPDRKALHSVWDELPYIYPGYCVMSPDRIKVSTNGDVHPCCVAEGETLRLGNLHQQSFADIWNGPASQDLRRAMLTGDLPDICRSCKFHTAWQPAAREHLPFVDWYHDHHCGGTVPRVAGDRRTLAVSAPTHLSRLTESPEFTFAAGGESWEEYHIVVSVAGSWHPANRVFVAPATATSWRMPEADWLALPPNTGLWWCVYALRRNELDRTLRSPNVQCFIRHEAVPRIAGSTLYGDAQSPAGGAAVTTP